MSETQLVHKYKKLDEVEKKREEIINQRKTKVQQTLDFKFDHFNERKKYLVDAQEERWKYDIVTKEQKHDENVEKVKMEKAQSIYHKRILSEQQRRNNLLKQKQLIKSQKLRQKELKRKINEGNQLNYLTFRKYLL